MKTDTVQTPAPAAAAVEEDRVIYRSELPKLLNVGTEAVRRYIKAGKLPKPDVNLSRRTCGWRLSTLRAHGIGVL
ncbi:MAG: hypothetical protein V4757_02370 [Pseudomonadota bacterium]